jgi:hypothetical protein
MSLIVAKDQLGTVVKDALKKTTHYDTLRMLQRAQVVDFACARTSFLGFPRNVWGI